MMNVYTNPVSFVLPFILHSTEERWPFLGTAAFCEPLTLLGIAQCQTPISCKASAIAKCQEGWGR